MTRKVEWNRSKRFLSDFPKERLQQRYRNGRLAGIRQRHVRRLRDLQGIQDEITITRCEAYILMVNKCCSSCGAHIFDTPKVLLITTEQEVFVTATWELQRAWILLSLFLSLSLSLSLSLCPSLSLYLPIYLTLLIILLAVVSFDYETKSRLRCLLSRAFVCLLDPRCIVRHPTALLHPVRGRIARYNGPLHNGIRTCDIPGGRRVASPRCCTRHGGREEAFSPFSPVQSGTVWGLYHAKFLMWYDSDALMLFSCYNSHWKREIMWIFFLQYT